MQGRTRPVRRRLKLAIALLLLAGVGLGLAAAGGWIDLRVKREVRATAIASAAVVPTPVHATTTA
jgi:hypothetical protein